MGTRELLVIGAAIAAYLVLDANRGLPENSWRVRPSLHGDAVRLEVNSVLGRRHTRWSADTPLRKLEGLSRPDLEGRGRNVQFAMVRDAGALVFEGVLNGGAGSGGLRFRPDPDYAAEMKRLGYGEMDADTLWSLALAEVSLDFARGLRDAGWKGTARDLMHLRANGVDGGYLRRLSDAGYAHLDTAQIIRLRQHGID